MMARWCSRCGTYYDPDSTGPCEHLDDPDGVPCPGYPELMEDRSMTDRQPPDRRIVQLFKDGDQMGIRTTATTDEEFWRHLSAELGALIDAGRFAGDWDFQLSIWLPEAFEIAAKLRGYKADVFEERVLYAGAAFVNEARDVRHLAPVGGELA